MIVPSISNKNKPHNFSKKLKGNKQKRTQSCIWCFLFVQLVIPATLANNPAIGSLTNPGFTGKGISNISTYENYFSADFKTNLRSSSTPLVNNHLSTDNYSNTEPTAKNAYNFTYPESVNKTKATVTYTGLGAYVIGSVFFYNYVWYKDMEWTKFHFYNDNKDWLQMDKHGHMYSAYHQTRYAYHLFRWIGYNKKASLWISSSISTFIQLQVELWDGFYDGYGFSYGDIVANTLGTSLFAVQEAIFDEQILKLKFSYSPSKYREMSPEKLGENHLKSLFLDYNGHTQWISGSLQKLTGIEALPSWLCISVGFGANGMLSEVNNNSIPDFEHIERYRQTFLSLDVDLSRLNIRNPILKGLAFVANMIKFPAPALEYNRVDGFRFRPLYF